MEELKFCLITALTGTYTYNATAKYPALLSVRNNNLDIQKTIDYILVVIYFDKKRLPLKYVCFTILQKKPRHVTQLAVNLIP